MKPFKRAPFAPLLQSSENERVQRSLFGEILDWLLAPLLLLWPMSIAITYLVAKSIANQPFDHALENRVQVLAQQFQEKSAAALPLSARELLRADDQDQILYQVRSTDGRLLDGDAELPLPKDEERPATGVVLLRTEVLHGTELRIAYSYLESPRSATPEGTRGLWVQVGESLEKRSSLANEIIKGVILPQFLILPIALALVWMALSRGLSPLTELQARIRQRRSDDLSPIDAHPVPEEIAPLVDSLNDMLTRLAQNIEVQKRFVADAAHQMKTPLAGMRMQAELALRESNPDEVRRSLQQLLTSSAAATRLINQLLTLARTENAPSAATTKEALDLGELARDTVREWVGAALAQGVDLGLECPDHPIPMFGAPLLLHELLGNLLDNALRYSPAGGSVTVRVRVDVPQDLAILEVEDQGPGIPEGKRERIFERFYRILGSGVPGSGLGLAIVREIALQHDAHIEVLNNPRAVRADAPGALFRILFRMNPHADLLEPAP